MGHSSFHVGPSECRMVAVTRLIALKISISLIIILVFLNFIINYISDIGNFMSKRRANNICNTLHMYVNRKRSPSNSSYDFELVSKLNNFTDGSSLSASTFSNAITNLNAFQPNLTEQAKVCTDPLEGGPISPDTKLESLEAVEERLGKYLNSGGWFRPTTCKAKHHVAIIVPFRDRYAHLSIFLKNIHPFLFRQNIEYRIFVIEQANGLPFNRAALMNIGYLESLKFFPWDCFVFHDVDLLPLDERNLYSCPRQPRHMSVAIDTFNFRLPYNTIFGGVSAMTRQQFSVVNGFSNSFFGWGGEDDDMFCRLKNANYFIARYPINIARYMMLSHQKERANPKRFEILANGVKNFKMDGLNTIRYEIYSMKELPIFTWYLAELFEPKCQT